MTFCLNHLRNGFVVPSERLLNELRSFIYINGRPDHAKNSHDDAIMALAMALYVAQSSFAQLKANVAQAKAMIESYAVNENKSDGVLPQLQTFKQESNIQGIEETKKYMWLFSGLRR